MNAAETLEQAKARLQECLDDGAVCPCCGQYAKRYRRKLNSAMAHALVLFYRYVNAAEGYVHVPSIPELRVAGRPGGGDWAKLALWGLIEERTSDRTDGGPHAGWWRLTHAGVRFVLGQMRLPRYLFLYNGSVVGFDSSITVSVVDALGDHFSYRELMGGYLPERRPTQQLKLFSFEGDRS